MNISLYIILSFLGIIYPMRTSDIIELYNPVVLISTYLLTPTC